MNKNLKVISSLAMAGILAATGISTVSAATTKSLGVYRKVVEGKAIVPYVLSSANDRVAVQDLNSEFGVTLSNGTTVKTGTTFNKSGEEHTVVVYGDVNSDGRVNVNDVTETAKAVFNTPTGVVKEAADVAHDGKINVNDVTTLAKFIVKNEALNINLKSEEEQTNYTYTLEASENNIINSENVSSAKVVITPKDEFVAKTYTIKVVKEDGKTVVSEIASLTFTGNANEKTVSKDLDFSDAKVTDGNYIVRLELEGKTVGEVKVEKHADTTNLKANVVATRVGSDNAVVSLESAENAKIVKIYCTIASTKPAKNDVVEKGRAITVTNNVLRETSITNNDVAASGQSLYYVLEDSYGSRTEGSVVIPNDNATAATTTIETIAAQESENKFDITLNAEPASSKNVIVTLYKDGKAIDTATVPTTTATATADFTSAIKEVGSYTVKAYVEATATEKQSATVDSAATAENAGKIVVSQLAQVTDVKVDVENSKITWKDTSNKDASYEVTVLEPEKVDGKYTGKYVTKETASSVDQAKKEATLPAITANTSYRVQVVAKNASKRVLDSEAATSNDFFTVKTPTAPTVDNQSLEKAVKLTGIEKAELAGDSNATISYAVEVYNVEGNETKLVATKAATLTKTEGQDTYETVVDGLEAGKTYKFVLTVTINGVTKKAPITSGNVIVKNSIAINGLTVNEAATEAKQGEIYTNGTKAYINGETIENIGVFSTEYQAILNDIVKGLKTGDKVTISGNNIKLELNHNASATTALGASIKGKNVEVIGNGYYRTLTTADKASKVVLGANNGRGYFAVSTALNAEEVILEGVTLQSTVGTYTVKANTTTTINGVVAKVSKDTKVTPTSGKLTVVASDSNLELSTNTDLALEISGEKDLALRQTGNVTINAKNGDITLTSPKATVAGNINVTIENGELNVTADTLAGAKNVVVNNTKGETTTVVANLKTTAPFTTTAAVKVKAILDTYAETEALDTVSDLTVASGKTAKEVVDFVKGLGIGEEADASIEISDGVVTLTFEGIVTNYKVLGIN